MLKIPAWVLDLIIKLAIQFGIPWIIANIGKIPFIGPWLAKNLPANLREILEELIKSVGGAKMEARTVARTAKAKARSRIKAECLGVACLPEVKE